MRFSDPTPAIRPRLARIAAQVERFVVRAEWVLGTLALATLIGTGEWLTIAQGGEGLISIPALRGLHAMAGLLLVGVAVHRVGGGFARLFVSALHHRGRLPVPWPLLRTRCASGRWWLLGLFFGVLLLLVLSGLERYVQVRFGHGLLPGSSPFLWTALHRALPLYLYALLLLIVLTWGKMAGRRLLDYLYTP